MLLLYGYGNLRLNYSFFYEVKFGTRVQSHKFLLNFQITISFFPTDQWACKEKGKEEGLRFLILHQGFGYALGQGELKSHFF